MQATFQKSSFSSQYTFSEKYISKAMKMLFKCVEREKEKRKRLTGLGLTKDIKQDTSTVSKERQIT